MESTTPMTRALTLDLPEFALLARHFGWSVASGLSPLPGLCKPGSKGQARTLEQVLEPLGKTAPHAASWALSPLVAADRTIDAWSALYDSSPSGWRLYGSRKVEQVFAGLRLHSTHDRELLFPVTPPDLESWLHQQLQLSAGHTLPLADAELDAEQLAFLLALADAFRAVYVGGFARSERRLAPVLTAQNVMQAQLDGAAVRDRRWLSTAVNEFLGLLIHPGGASGVALPELTRQVVERELKRLLAAGHLTLADDSTHPAYVLSPSLKHFAGDMLTWLNVICLHDVQIVGGSAEEPSAQEDLLIYMVTPNTVWTLASEGLTRAGGDLSGVRFGLRSCDVVTALEIGGRFFETLPDAEVPEGFYDSVRVLPEREAGVCSSCGKALRAGNKFCVGCGDPAK